jgi:ferredoxin-NADP reductase/MOSC domain-containing protein YiiM
MVRRLNIDGDGQGDLAGHGGEQRAVMVYQTESYDYWSAELGRADLVPGNFGENFTISGMSDEEVCVGDRYRIGEAEFEVTQPRVTCFRVGMRLGEPEMPKLLVAHHRPGFYFRVIAEGRVQAGDEIVRTHRGRLAVSIAEVDAMLYLPNRHMDRIAMAVDVPALSPGWQQSFRDMLAAEHDSARPVTTPGWPGFRPLRVRATRRETADVLSIEFEPADGPALATPLAGQYITLKIPGAGDPAPLRSYSLSGDSSTAYYRISVKREKHGLVSQWLHANIRAGSIVQAAAPRGDFYLTDDTDPIVLLSAGIGATPVLAMLHALASARSQRTIWWVHTTRSRETHAFATETADLIASLANARENVFYTAGQIADRGVIRGRLDRDSIAALGLPADAEVFLCGPEHFMSAMRTALTAAGIADSRIHTELFGALAAINPGVVQTTQPPRPHVPAGNVGTGPLITFSRSGISTNWSSAYGSILELAEACDVPTRFACRSGVCHTCVTGIVSGSATYTQPPLEEPPATEILICCAAPASDLVLDL